MNKRYLRVGKIPPDGKSKIFYNGEYIVGQEAGLSTYEMIEIDGRYRLILPQKFSSFLLTDIQWNFSDLNKELYILSGDIVGYGSDGEPLLSDIKIFQEMKVKDFLRRSDCKFYSDEYLDGVGYPDTYYIKLYDIKWYMAGRKFFDEFIGKKIYLPNQYSESEVEHFWREKNEESSSC